jgi:hypothetical protein
MLTQVVFGHAGVAHGDAVAPKLAQTGLPEPALHIGPARFPNRTR